MNIYMYILSADTIFLARVWADILDLDHGGTLDQPVFQWINYCYNSGSSTYMHLLLFGGRLAYHSPKTSNKMRRPCNMEKASMFFCYCRKPNRPRQEQAKNGLQLPQPLSPHHLWKHTPTQSSKSLPSVLQKQTTSRKAEHKLEKLRSPGNNQVHKYISTLKKNNTLAGHVCTRAKFRQVNFHGDKNK